MKETNGKKTILMVLVALTCLLCMCPAAAQAKGNGPHCVKSRVIYLLPAVKNYTYSPGIHKSTIYGDICEPMKIPMSANPYDTVKDIESKIGGWILIEDVYGILNITDLKSSNPKFTAWYDYSNDSGQTYIKVLPKKIKNGNFATGTTKITFNVKWKGKKYKLSCKCTIKKEPHAFKSLKVGKKDYTKFFKIAGGNSRPFNDRR